MVVLNGRAAPKDKVRFVLALRHSVTSTSGGPAVFQRGAAAIEERRKVITGLFIMKKTWDYLSMGVCTYMYILLISNAPKPCRKHEFDQDHGCFRA